MGPRLRPITHAYVTYCDSKKKSYTLPISSIEYKKNSDSHLEPENDTDFDKLRVYFANWSDCHYGKGCKKNHEHSGYYAAFIHYLGESVEQVQEKVEVGGRLIIPNKIESSESEENVKPSRRQKHTTTVQDVQKRKNLEVLEKLNSQTFVKSRKQLIDESDDDIGNHEESDPKRPRKKVNDNTNDEDYGEKLTRKDREIEELKKMIDELKQRQEATMAREQPSSQQVLRVRKNLFIESDDDTDVPLQQDEINDVHKEDQIDEFVEQPSALPSSRNAVKPGIARIETVNINNIRELLEKKINTLTKNSSKENDMGIGAEDMMEAGPSTKHHRPNTAQSDATSHAQEEPVSPLFHNNHANVSDEDHDDHENQQDVRERLPLREKRKRPGNIPRGLKRKSHQEIDDAQKYYNNDEVDRYGRKHYEPLDNNKIYLGEGIEVDITAWYLIKDKKPNIFFNDLIGMLWTSEELVNRCQNEKKVMTKLANRSPMKKLTPEKKRLSYKLYADYLDYKRIKKEQKYEYLAKVGYLYTSKINYLRGKYYQ